MRPRLGAHRLREEPHHRQGGRRRSLAAKDLSNNKPEATRANAAAEGVADRVEVETGDITRLPFADASFDAVISMTVIHNIPSREGRDQALRELVRVLKPGGRLAIFDLLHTSRYAEVLQGTGMKVRDLATISCGFSPAARCSQENLNARRNQYDL